MSTSVYGKITVIKRNGASGSQYPVTNSHCTFGRDADCEIRIQLPTVSERECKLQADENGNFILSRINREGEIMVNSKKVSTDASINHNDVLTIAGRSFRFEYPPSMRNMDNMTEAQMKSIGTPQSTLLQRVKQGNRRVSFGPQLSPEQFAAFMPPNTPVKKGALPMQGLGNTPMDTARRSSVLREKKGTPSVQTKVVKRKSIGKSSTPKSAEETKTGRKRSFDELVELVGLSKPTKSAKNTPAQKRSTSKQATPVVKRDEIESSVNATNEKKKTPNKRRSKQMSPKAVIAEIIDDSDGVSTPKTALNSTEKTPSDRKSIGKSPVPKIGGTLPVSPDLFDFKDTPSRRKSRIKSETPKSTAKATNVYSDSNLTPMVAENKATPSNKKRRSSVQVATPTVDDNQTTSLDDTVPYQPSPVAAPKSSTKKRRSSMKIATLRAESPQKDVHTELEDSLPYEAPVRKSTTPGRKSKRSSTKLATPKMSEPLDGTMEDSEGQCTLDVTLPYDEFSAATPSAKRKSMTSKSDKKTLLMVDVDYYDVNDTLPYVDDEEGSEVIEQEATPGKSKTPKSGKISTPASKTPKSTSKTPKSVGGTPVTDVDSDVTMDYDEGEEDFDSSYIELQIIERKTPARKSIGKTPKSVAKSVQKKTQNMDSSYVKNKTTTPVQKVESKTPKSALKSSKKTPNVGKITSEAENVDSSFTELQVVPKAATPAQKTAEKTPKSAQKTLKVTENLDSSYEELFEAVNKSKKSPKQPETEEDYDESYDFGILESSLPVSRQSLGKTPVSIKKSRRSSVRIEQPQEVNVDNIGVTKSTVQEPKSASKSKVTPGRRSIPNRTPRRSFDIDDVATNIEKEASYNEESSTEASNNKKATPGRRSISTKTPRRSVDPPTMTETESLRSQESSKSALKRKPGRPSISRKTPRKSLGVSRKSISKSAKRKSLRIKRKSGVLLWSEVVRRNTDKQPEIKTTSSTAAEMFGQSKQTKRGVNKPVAKTPKQIRALRHADSPATIYIGKTQKRVDEDLDMTPVDFNMSTDHSSEESFTEGESVLSVIDEPKQPKYVKKTPKQKHAPVEEHFGTKRLLKTPKNKTKSEPVKEHFGTKRLLKTPKEKVKAAEIKGDFGAKRLMKTPKVKGQEVSDHFGTKRLLKTPKQKTKSEPVTDKFGTKRLLTTPKEKKKNLAVEEHFGTKRLLKTPTTKVKNAPVEKNLGTKRMFTTPKGKTKNSPVKEKLGLKRLLRTPKEKVIYQQIEGDYGLDTLFGKNEVVVQQVSESQAAEESLEILEEKKTDMIKPVTKAKKTPSKAKVTEKLVEEQNKDEVPLKKENSQKISEKKEVKKQSTKLVEKLVEEPKEVVIDEVSSKDEKVAPQVAASGKKSTRKRKTPASLDDNFVVMPEKKVKSDKEATVVTEKAALGETQVKRSSRSRKAAPKEVKTSKDVEETTTTKMSVPIDEEVNTEINPVVSRKSTRGKKQHIAVEETAPVKRSSRGRKNEPAAQQVTEVLPTKRSTRGRNTRTTAEQKTPLEAIAEQDETQTSKENEKLETINEKPQVVKEAPKRSRSRSTKRGQTAEVEQPEVIEISPVEEKQPAKPPRSSRTAKKSTSDVEKPKETQAQPEVAENALVEKKEPTKPTRSGRFTKKTTVAEIPDVAQTQSEAAPARSSRRGKNADSAKPFSGKKVTFTNETIEQEVAPAPKRNVRSKKVTEVETSTKSVEEQSENVKTAPKRTSRSKKTVDPESATSAENVDEVIQAVPKRAARSRKASKEASGPEQTSKSETEVEKTPEPVTTSKRSRTTKTTKPETQSRSRTGRSASQSQPKEDVESTTQEPTARASRKRKTPDIAEVETEPKRCNQGTAAAKEPEVAKEEPKRSTRTKKAPSEPKKVPATKKSAEPAPVRKSSRATRAKKA